jgi:hypothetical protein
MINFYYVPGACSMATPLALEEAGIDYQAVAVDLKGERTEYFKINPVAKYLLCCFMIGAYGINRRLANRRLTQNVKIKCISGQKSGWPWSPIKVRCYS